MHHLLMHIFLLDLNIRNSFALNHFCIEVEQKVHGHQIECRHLRKDKTSFTHLASVLIIMFLDDRFVDCEVNLCPTCSSRCFNRMMLMWLHPSSLRPLEWMNQVARHHFSEFQPQCSCPYWWEEVTQNNPIKKNAYSMGNREFIKKLIIHLFL